MLPVLKPHGGDEEIEALSKVIKSGWWGKGPLVKEFEEKFAKMVGAKSIFKAVWLMILPAFIFSGYLMSMGILIEFS